MAATAPKPTFREVPLDDIVQGENIRTSVWKAEDSAALIADVKRVGVRYPVLLTTRRGLPTGKFLLVCGYRRYSAACEAGARSVPARILPGLTDFEIVEEQGRENLQRRDMNGMEIARMLSRMRDMSEATSAELGAKFGRSPQWASTYLSLLKLPATVQALVEAGELADTTAYEFARCLKADNAAKVEEVAMKVSGSPRRLVSQALTAAGLRVPKEDIQPAVRDWGQYSQPPGDDSTTGPGTTPPRRTVPEAGCQSACCDCCSVPWHTQAARETPRARA